jgi:hypothetical protein
MVKWKVATRIALVLIGLAVGKALYSLRWEIWPTRFAVVEEGWLYRSGQIDARLIDGVIDRFGIEAILAAKWMDPEEPDVAAELAAVERNDLDYIEVRMPGNGAGSLEALDQAADWIASHSHHPLLVHCDAGRHRSNASIAAYRMKHCGWSLEEALSEARKFGLRDRHEELITRLTEYYERIRHATSGDVAEAGGRAKK